jgi:hypothetical protein
MNLYWVITDSNQYNYLTVASSVEQAQKIGNSILRKSCRAERVKDGQYIVAATYIMDSVL